MFYAFNLVDTKDIDTFTMSNINKINIIGFKKLEQLENFVENNYTYIGIYNHSDRFTVPINFKSKKDAQLELIRCLNSIKEECYGRNA